MKDERPEDPHWFCLRTEPKHEHIAAKHLRRVSHIEVFCPQLRFRKATSRGVKWFVEAMFPGYIFGKFPFAERHREVQYSTGVTSILAFGGRYARIPDEVVASLKEYTNGTELVEIHSQFTPGETVKIVTGALSGLEAVITQVLPAKERVRILLNFLGQEIQAEVATPSVISEQTHPLRREN